MRKTVYFPFYCIDPITTESTVVDRYDQKKDLLITTERNNRIIILSWGPDSGDDFFSILKKSESPCLIPLSFIVDKGYKI